MFNYRDRKWMASLLAKYSLVPMKSLATTPHSVQRMCPLLRFSGGKSFRPLLQAGKAEGVMPVWIKEVRLHKLHAGVAVKLVKEAHATAHQRVHCHVCFPSSVAAFS